MRWLNASQRRVRPSRGLGRQVLEDTFPENNLTYDFKFHPMASKLVQSCNSRSNSSTEQTELNKNETGSAWWRVKTHSDPSNTRKELSLSFKLQLHDQERKQGQTATSTPVTYLVIYGFGLVQLSHLVLAGEWNCT
jgi:hypothetical protein